MNTYQITANLSIEGNTLKDAIETNFTKIAKHLNLGNAAGYQLQKVWCEYEKNIQAAVLHITACGSDLQVNYDPTTDKPKDYTLKITAKQEDCPDRIDFELTENQQTFNPFDDTCLTTPSSYYGTILALIDEVALNHCKITAKDNITRSVTCKYPNMSTAYPLKYIELCRNKLTTLKPKTDNETTRIMERISELTLKILDYPNDHFNSATIAQAKTSIYFDTLNKITALAKIRTEKGMTQKQLADAAQISVRQLQNYEKCPNSTLWSASKFIHKRLANVLDIDISQIIDKNGFAKLVNK